MAGVNLAKNTRALVIYSYYKDHSAYSRKKTTFFKDDINEGAAILITLTNSCVQQGSLSLAQLLFKQTIIVKYDLHNNITGPYNINTTPINYRCNLLNILKPSEEGCFLVDVFIGHDRIGHQKYDS